MSANAPSNIRARPSIAVFLASRIGEQIVKLGKKKVAVDRFFAQKQIGSYALGAALSEEFAAALAKMQKDVEVFDRAYLVALLKQRSWPEIDIEDSEVFRSIAHLAGAQAVVTAKFKNSGDVLELTLMVLETSNEKKIAETKARITKTQAMNLRDSPVHDSTGLYLPFIGGVSAPECRHCLEPEFPPEAREKISAAAVVLRITVAADGRPADIRLVRGAGHGLDEKSIEAVRRWTLIPARLPNGTIVPVRLRVEINFRTRP